MRIYTFYNNVQVFKFILRSSSLTIPHTLSSFSLYLNYAYVSLISNVFPTDHRRRPKVYQFLGQCKSRTRDAPNSQPYLVTFRLSTSHHSKSQEYPRTASHILAEETLHISASHVSQLLHSTS